MHKFQYSFFTKFNSSGIRKGAADMTVLAHGLLGQVNEFWMQEVSEAGVTMHFLMPMHASEFMARWTSLTLADRDRSLPQSRGPKARPAPKSPVTKHTCTIILPFDVVFKESRRIEADLLAQASGMRTHLTSQRKSENGMLDKLVYLAVSLGVECEFEADDNGSCDYPVMVTFGNRAEMEGFVCAVERLGWGKREHERLDRTKRMGSGSTDEWLRQLLAILRDVKTTSPSD
jgi:hypothetical protein